MSDMVKFGFLVLFLISSLIQSEVALASRSQWNGDTITSGSRYQESERRWVYTTEYSGSGARRHVAYNMFFGDTDYRFGFYCYESSRDARVFLTMHDSNWGYDSYEQYYRETNSELHDTAFSWELHILVDGVLGRLTSSYYEHSSRNDFVLGQRAASIRIEPSNYRFYMLKSGQDAWVDVVTSFIDYTHEDQRFLRLIITNNQRVPIDGSSSALNQLNQHCRLWWVIQS